ncbi:MAG TPA: hypothetical protein VK712_02425 [Verrucomicrobiae bacterium]|jgi:hypothetical protein|nr:hypothetical protein [Verrucomicrobiae bacterium]
MNQESLSAAESSKQLSPEEIIALKREFSVGRNADGFNMLETKVAVTLVMNFHLEGAELVKNDEAYVSPVSHYESPEDHERRIALSAVRWFDALKIAINLPGHGWSNEFPVEWAAQALAIVKADENAQASIAQGAQQEQYG